MLNRKGFTLSELLIVVAVIGVLTGVAIPVFNGIQEKSRETVDLANIRNAHTEVLVEVLTGNEDLYDKNNPIIVKLVQTEDGWRDDTAEDTLNNLGQVKSTPTKDGTCLVYWNATTGKMMFHFAAEFVPFPAPSDIYDVEWRDNFAESYVELLEQLVKTDALKNAITTRKASIPSYTYGDVSFKEYNSKETTFHACVNDAMTELGYPQATINKVDSYSSKVFVYFDADNNVLCYRYSIYTPAEKYVLSKPDGSTSKTTTDASDVTPLAAVEWAMTP